ncbi:LysR substrate-binding domain-containing protein [Pseudorhodobacter sp.]|uniref:LysR substrate-binding domain-containing protein n=1 Tax=Pseudorhodobacter sp. TaxID=1934400 RepID=UPI002AFFD323|nr:LysR substrate-binding domain-containing protein [Pseudorhodobacter sp.]
MLKLRRIFPSLNGLYVIDAVSRHLSFTAAANELGISQPAVSKSFRQLEQNLGVDLVMRQHRGLSLTPEGEVFALQVRAALTAIDQAAQQIRTSSGGQKIRINVSSSFVSMWLVPRIAEFRAQNPSILFEITENNGDLDPQTFSLCDFTTRIGRGGWVDATSTRLARERLFALASPEYVRAHPDCLRLETLQKTNLLHATEPKRSRMGWKEWFRATGTSFASEPDVLFSDHHSAIHAALVGQGVALGWQHLVGGYLKKGQLVRVTNAVVQTRQHVYLVSPLGRALQNHHDLFRTWIVEQFRQNDQRLGLGEVFESDIRSGE